jgi:hypothetical protein
LGSQEVVNRKSAELSPLSITRVNRQRLAREEGVRAMADIEQGAVAIRKNMERLRALRQAKEAQEASASPVVTAPLRKKRNKAISN